jgi:hypothetical protein
MPLLAAVLATHALTCPQDPSRLPTVVVTSRADSLIGSAGSASEGAVGAEDLRLRPLSRPAEVLEAVPGVVVTQHSGAGKSNQQFARGFNLDHGTDLATSLWNVPLNMPSHGHGQGYTDLNPLIPELVDTVRWRMGPYDVRDGDFASAGAIDIGYVRRLDRGILQLTAGSYGHARTLIADSHRVGEGDLLMALELQRSDGRFTVDQDYDKRNAFLSWSTATFRVAGFAHAADWTSTDQIPRRAVVSGLLGRFDSLDPTAGGSTSWYGATATWQPELTIGGFTWTTFAFQYELDLWSNFTYALDDPIAGDQFEQRDARSTWGLAVERSLPLGGDDRTALAIGAEYRGDRIRNGLHAATARVRRSTVRNDAIDQHSVAAYGELQWQPLDWLRARGGLRLDQYFFAVDSDLAANSGHDDDAIASGKAGVAIGPFHDTEVYANVGTGFHSNDARGVVLRDDPATPTPDDGDPVSPLVRSRGAELGLRTSAVEGLQSTLSFWLLELDSELLFVGDAGSTEPSRASRRTGIEFANHWRPVPWLGLDADLTTSRSRFRGDSSDGNRIPGAVPLTFAAGITADWTADFATSLRVRHLDPRPLREDGAVRSSSTTLFNARATWRIDASREFTLDVLNLFDRRASDIEYSYESQLPGESAPVEDVHFHPVEPFTIRLMFTARF